MNKEKEDHDKTPTIKKCNKSNLIYDSNDIFYKYYNIKKLITIHLIQNIHL